MNQKIDGLKENFPESVAIIMDGNGRWAQKRGFEIRYGHKQGAENLIKILQYSKKIGIKSLTVYAFSTENWKRPKAEVNSIIRLLKFYLEKNKNEFKTNNVKLKVIGCLDGLDKNIVQNIRNIEKETENNDGLYFNVAFGYGGRKEIVDATKKIVKDVKNGILDINDLDENIFKKYLYNEEIIYPDLVIRTGGDLRLSNFLLWEVSYSELYFTDTLWPDFDEKALDLAINNFKHRKRTYGERKAKR